MAPEKTAWERASCVRAEAWVRIQFSMGVRAEAGARAMLKRRVRQAPGPGWAFPFVSAEAAEDERAVAPRQSRSMSRLGGVRSGFSLARLTARRTSFPAPCRATSRPRTACGT